MNDTTDTTPSRVELTCTVTGKKVVWTNRKIIADKIKQFGSLDAFKAQYKSKGRKKAATSIAAIVTSEPVMKDICDKGVELGKMSAEEYARAHPCQEVPTPGAQAVIENKSPLSAQPEITVTGNPSPKAAKAIVEMVKKLIKNGTIKSAGYVWVSQEGWTDRHDDLHTDGELAEIVRKHYACAPIP